MWVEIEKELDVAGVHQVRVQPFGIATFGRDIDDALAQAEDAVHSYVHSLIQRNALLDEFERLGVEHKTQGVRATPSTEPAHVEFEDEIDARRVEGSGHALLPA